MCGLLRIITLDGAIISSIIQKNKKEEEKT